MTDERPADRLAEDRLQERVEQWRQTTRAKAVSSAQERRETFTTSSDLEIADVYTAADLGELGFDAERDLGLPGEPPFTRGVQATMYRSRFWTMR
ncbi:MAG TPA: methylmalonyl-CoA mutase family protein, partial [Candidatus Limnocylindrales bacterium]